MCEIFTRPFSLLISLGREPESNSDWITEDNDLITVHTSSGPCRTWERRGASAMTDTQTHTHIGQTVRSAEVTKKKKSSSTACVISEWILNPRPDRLSEENQNMLQLVLLELLSILKSSPSPKVPTALIKVVQLEKLCNIPLDEGRQGTTITLHSGEHLCLPELCTLCVALSIYLNEGKKDYKQD